MNYDYDLKCEVLNLSRLFGNWMMIGSYTSLFGVKQPIVLIYKFLRLRQNHPMSWKVDPVSYLQTRSY